MSSSPDNIWNAETYEKLVLVAAKEISRHPYRRGSLDPVEVVHETLLDIARGRKGYVRPPNIEMAVFAATKIITTIERRAKSDARSRIRHVSIDDHVDVAAPADTDEISFREQVVRDGVAQLRALVARSRLSQDTRVYVDRMVEIIANDASQTEISAQLGKTPEQLALYRHRLKKLASRKKS